jgi:anti-anti-sigma factor
MESLSLPASLPTVSLRLAGGSADLLHDLAEHARAELRSGAKRLHIDLEALDRLDSPAVSVLITILRAAHLEGADVALGATRQAVLDTLRVTGLDKLFPNEPAPEGAPRPMSATPPHPARGASKRRIAAGLAGLVAVLSLQCAVPAQAGSAPEPSELVSHLVAQNPDMRSFQATLHVDFQLRTFPYIAQHLDGTAYFKRPDNYEVVFTNVPSYARGFDKLFADIGDPSGWERRFVVSVAGEREIRGRRDTLIRLVQRVRGMIDHEDVAVDTHAWRIDQMEWHYYNGGVISMTQDYQSVNGFNVLKAQHATIRIPYIHASAEGRYDGYRTNVAIDDAVFTRNQK